MTFAIECECDENQDNRQGETNDSPNSVIDPATGPLSFALRSYHRTPNLPAQGLAVKHVGPPCFLSCSIVIIGDYEGPLFSDAATPGGFDSLDAAAATSEVRHKRIRPDVVSEK